MAEEFIRTPTKASGPLTEAEKVQLKAVSDEWIAISYQLGRTDKEKLITAVKSLYAVVDHPAPPVAVVPSPYVMAVASVVCTQFWRDKAVGNHLTAHKGVEEALKILSDDEQIEEVRKACYAVLPLAIDVATLTDADGSPDTSTISLGDYLQGGNFWPALPAFYAGCRDVLGLKLPCFDKYPPWEDCAKLGGYRWIHEEFCLVCDFPDSIQVDEQYRPHCETGPSHEWSDGWKLWYIQGRRVTEQIVMRPETLTVKQINDESDNDLRAIMLERKGWANYIREAELEPLEVFENDVETSIEVLYSTPFKHKVLVATCTTGRLFAMPVPDTIETCEAARSWIHGSKKRNIIART